MSVFTFTAGTDPNFLSAGCPSLVDVNSMSQGGSDIFPNISDESLAVTSTDLADLSGYVKVTENTGDPEPCVVGNMINVLTGPLAGIHLITECISSGVFWTNLPWLDCFEGEEIEYNIFTPAKVDANPGTSIIGDEVCIASNLVDGDNRFVSYVSVDYGNCNTEVADSCTTTVTTTTFSGDDSIDEHTVVLSGGTCTPSVHTL